MTRPVLTFGTMLAVAALVTALVGWQAVAGFIIGVTTTLAAGAIAGAADFESRHTQVILLHGPPICDTAACWRRRLARAL